MLIKTTHDGMDIHSFIGFSDESDTKLDYDVTAIYFKIWAMNTINEMQNSSK